MQVTLSRRAWHVPRQDCAFAGWLEGRVPDTRRETAIARARQRAAWKPGPKAWDQLIQLQGFIGRQVRIQFSDDGSILLAEDELPKPVDAHCEGIVTMIDEGHLQAFLLLRDIVNIRTGEPTESSCLVERSAINASLAPVAEICEIEAA